MKIGLVAATAAAALFAGSPAFAIDASFDPVLSTSFSNENTTSSPNLPLQSRPGAVSSGERSNDPGEGMPPHSPGLPPTSYAPPPSRAPVYYSTQPTYYTLPQYVVTQPAYVAPAPGTSINALVGSPVSDMYGTRVGQVTDVMLLADHRAVAIVGLGQWPGSVERVVTLPLDQLHRSTNGGLAYNATADQIWSMPIYR